MSKKAFIFLVVSVIIIIIALVALHGAKNKNVPVTNEATSTGTGTFTTSPDKTFPVASSTGVASPDTRTATVPSSDGTGVVVNNFIKNGSVVLDPSKNGYYFFLTNTEEYAISYNTASGVFTISLLEEPLGASRTDAEAYLARVLGITQNQMCNLRYYVGTSYQVNSLYDSGNLGFSYCSGATPLPQ